MKSKIIKSIIAIVSIFSLGSLLLAPATYAIDANVCDNSLPAEVLEANGCDNKSSNALPKIIQNILIAIIAILGIVAVVFVIIGGVQYMTSAGDSGKVEKGKKTILYGIIGLVICVLAFAIVNFTAGIINNSEEGGDTGYLTTTIM